MVEIRHLNRADAESLALLANNRKVWDCVRDCMPYPYTLKDALEFIEFCHMQHPQTHFAIVFNDELAGVIGLVLQQDVYRKSAEIGYWIGEPFWGKGIATEAVKLMIDYGFAHLDIVRIFTGVFDFNIASQKILEKNGFVREGVFRNAVFKNNRLGDEIRFSIIKEC